MNNDPKSGICCFKIFSIKIIIRFGRMNYNFIRSSSLSFLGSFDFQNNVQCTMYNVQCTMYNVLCTMYNVQHTLFIVT